MIDKNIKEGGEILEQKVNFQVEEALPAWLEDYPEEKFTVFNACFLSTDKNSHKYDISEEVLRRDGSTILGNFLVAKVQFGDARSHEPDEIIYGYFPKEQEIRFEKSEAGIVKAWAYCVVSKLYSKEFNNIFDIQNLRDTSVEMTVMTDEENEYKVLGLNIYGLTCLGLSVNGSCPDAMMTMVRFSEEEAEEYFNKNEQNLTERFAEKTYKIDKSKEAVSDADWGNVDKAAMRSKIMEASNRNSLVNAVYALVETGWEEAPSEHLKYPIMEPKGDTFVYNRNALASALGYAKKENETAVVSKIEKIYKKLGINSDGKEEAAMSEDMEKLEEVVDTSENPEEEKVKQFEEKPEESTDKNDDVDDKDDEEESNDKSEEAEMSEETAEMSCEEAMTKCEQLQADIEEKENIIMEKDSKITAMEVELAELREFKCGIEKEKMAKCVEATMSEVKDFVDTAKFAELRGEGLACKPEELDAWSNKVKATCFSTIQKKGIKKQTSTVWTFSVPNDVDEEPTDFWSKMNNKYN